MSRTSQKAATLELRAKSLGIGSLKRHIVFCCGDKCVLSDEREELWNYLKHRIAELKLDQKGVFRTKAKCLRVCQQGAIAVVYPEGTWYANLDRDKLDRIVEEHLAAGRPVGDLAFATNPL